jgi:ParB family transcriptional regulator, chromosome partitioning protein
MARNALGRGLNALIREPEEIAPPAGPGFSGAAAAAAPALQTRADNLVDIDIELIDPSPFQPRTRFNEAALEELAQSIRSSGIIQPLIVRRKGARYELLAGERRWRAAQRAGLHRVPAVSREVPDNLALEITLVENLQREDLNPMEQARAFDRLMNEFAMTQEQVAERTGKDRASVANSVRLLRLEPALQGFLEDGKLTAGHGRALLSIADAGLRMALARRAARGGLTVRQIEKFAFRLQRTPVTKATSSPMDPNLRAAIDELQRQLGTRVLLRPRAGKRPGYLMLEYYEDAQLMGIYDRLMRA